MNKIFVGIVENNSSDASFKIDDVKALVQLLDLMIRHESFSVDQRTQLFGWRSECEKTILKLSPESEISDLLNRQVALETKADTGKGKQRQRQNRNRPARPAPQVPISRQRTRMDETNANTPGFSAFDDPLSRRGVHCASNSRPWSEPNLVQSINNANADSISQISLSSTGSAGSTESDNLSWDQLRSGVQFLFNAEDERSVNGGRNFGFRRDQDSTVIRRPDNMGRSGSLGAPGHELRQSQVSGNRLPAKARPDSMFADIAAWSEVSKDQRTRSESHLDSAGRANNEYHPFQGLPCYPLDEFGTQSSRTQHRHGPRSQGTDQSRMFNA